jgi:hypothetical protein
LRRERVMTNAPKVVVKAGEKPYIVVRKEIMVDGKPVMTDVKVYGEDDAKRPAQYVR